MKLAILFLLSAPVLGACGDDGATPTIDAPVVAAKVETVTCVGGEPEITAANGTNAYTPNAQTIAVGGAVKFTMPGAHNVVPDPTGSDAGLKVDFTETKCLKFTAAGTYGFHCGPHAFKGTITVN
ncbi:MAG: plastocyanin/azurin family copper-binding protein [Proteobacteria bacterium]|nr:plastocyanin/azurin family copper-binding protein [Pseudomonadota bacterium]